MTDSIFIPFPKELYDLIIIRSGGRMDPVTLAADQVWGFVECNSGEPRFWTEEGLEAFAKEFGSDESFQLGDTSKGYQWQRVFLPNGTQLRMTYKGRNAYAQVQHEEVVSEGTSYSPSQWVSKVADNTSRNAWRDIWVRFPGERDWKLSDELRQQQG